jgi:hypothetical protein
MKILAFIFLTTILCGTAFSDREAPPLPEDSRKWLDGKVTNWEDLKGKVVLLNVWTFGCWNSYRSLTWIASLQKQYPDLVIIGIHSPEFSWEKDRTRLREVMEKYGIRYSQVLDDDHEYWGALNNRFWPSFYLVDKQGSIRSKFFGETHAGDSNARKIETAISALLNE